MSTPDFSRLLVCGDRDWYNVLAINSVLGALNPRCIIEGHAPGADQIAHNYAVFADHFSDSVERVCRPANWRRYGKAAGPIRNREMLNAKPTFVLAFHNSIETSKGTADMLRIAHDTGVPYAVLTEDDCANW